MWQKYPPGEGCTSSLVLDHPSSSRQAGSETFTSLWDEKGYFLNILGKCQTLTRGWWSSQNCQEGSRFISIALRCHQKSPILQFKTSTFKIASSSIAFSKTVHVGRWPHVCSIVKKEDKHNLLFPLPFYLPSKEREVWLLPAQRQDGMAGSLLWALLSHDWFKLEKSRPRSGAWL